MYGAICCLVGDSGSAGYDSSLLVRMVSAKSSVCYMDKSCRGGTRSLVVVLVVGVGCLADSHNDTLKSLRCIAEVGAKSVAKHHLVVDICVECDYNVAVCISRCIRNRSVLSGGTRAARHFHSHSIVKYV